MLTDASLNGGNRRVAGARPCVVAGIKFHSRREARFWLFLMEDQRLGRITDLKRQVKVPLLGRDGPILTPTGKPAHYVADFTFTEVGTGAHVVADAKGHPTEIYLLKRAILAAQGIVIREL
ncbi:MAG: DUF1064 domain-containing protein [Paracoccaceae bacterium]